MPGASMSQVIRINWFESIGFRRSSWRYTEAVSRDRRYTFSWFLFIHTPGLEAVWNQEDCKPSCGTWVAGTGDHSALVGTQDPASVECDARTQSWNRLSLSQVFALQLQDFWANGTSMVVFSYRALWILVYWMMVEKKNTLPPCWSGLLGKILGERRETRIDPDSAPNPLWASVSLTLYIWEDWVLHDLEVLLAQKFYDL